MRAEGRRSAGVREDTYPQRPRVTRKARLLDQENGQEEVRRSIGQLQRLPIERGGGDDAKSHVRLWQERKWSRQERRRDQIWLHTGGLHAVLRLRLSRAATHLDPSRSAVVAHGCAAGLLLRRQVLRDALRQRGASHGDHKAEHDEGTEGGTHALQTIVGVQCGRCQ